MLLARHPLRQPGAAPAGLTVLDSEDPQVKPGRRIQGAIPRLSPEVADLPAPLALRFQIIVNAEGRPSDPLVLDPGPPGMVWEILEGVRGWRYLPAYRKKKPVAVTRTVSVNTPASLEPPPGQVPFETYRSDLEALASGRRPRGGPHPTLAPRHLSAAEQAGSPRPFPQPPG